MPISLIDPPTPRPVTDPARATTECSGRRKSWITTSQQDPKVAAIPSITGVRAAITASCSSAAPWVRARAAAAARASVIRSSPLSPGDLDISSTC